MTRRLSDSARAWPSGDTKQKPVGSWVVASRRVPCGACDRSIKAGDPLWQISAPTWRKVRCAACAGQAVPDVITEPGAVSRASQFAERIEAMRAGRDWKHAQAGEEGR